MCDVLPETYAKNCEAFVDEYGSSLLVLISQEIDPSITCYELKLCSNQTKLFDNHSKYYICSLKFMYSKTFKNKSTRDQKNS